MTEIKENLGYLQIPHKYPKNTVVELKKET
jgi:hypothetical protein